jgi:ABC-type multidrug transport system fused ATPase/permease subunit
MLVGLFANLVANGMKGALILRNAFLRLTGQSRVLAEQTNYLNAEQLEAATVAASLNQSHTNLTQTFTIEAAAVEALRNAYLNANLAAKEFATRNPGMMLPKKGRGYASGIVSVPGPKGAGDVVPAMLSPGEAVIPTDMAKKYAPLINGMVAGNIPGYELGKGFKNATMFLPESINTLMGQTGGKGVATFIGSLLAINIYLSGIFIASWLTMLLIFRISAVSALLGYLVTIIAAFIFWMVSGILPGKHNMSFPAKIA